MVKKLRVRNLTNVEYEKGTVIYQMCRELRASDNDALLFAQELALSRDAPLIVNYVIWNYLWQGATRRFYDWVLPSLIEVEKELRKHNIPLVITFLGQNFFMKKDFEKLPEHVGATVIEQIPLRFSTKWKEVYLKNHSSVPSYEVDAHNCIPVWETSNKQEFAARTIRSKVHAKLPEFLEEYDELQKHKPNDEIIKQIGEVDWDNVRKKIVCDESIFGIGVFTPGTKAGTKMLGDFLINKLTAYDTDRNNINKDGQSNLSPYISHGNISRRRIILELLKEKNIKIEHAFDPIKNGSKGTLGSIAAFIEETVVRSELAENFCFYNPHYDSYDSFLEWAKRTLSAHTTDKRDHIYTYDELKDGKTYDELWNAAQMQMVKDGKMHGYMRMYWAKKILEWTRSPEQAMKIAVKLNDVYELDGRDPNGYVGCAWSIGGVHDRPWFNRPIYGVIRYMAQSGVEKRGSIEQYIKKNLA